VLDLGPAVEDNVAFLGDLARRLQILDLGRQRPGDRQETGASLERDIALLRELLPEQAGAFHLVMTWDILNYVPRQRFKELMGVLSELCAPEARLFSMICESKTMSAAPNRYRVVRESRIVSESQTSDVKVAPEMPPAAVERLLTGFRIEHTFVLRHGVREYVAAKAKTAR
jgi:hypothetical protein